MEQSKSLSPLISQMFLVKDGLYCSERLSVDLYSLVECIYLLIPTLDEKLLKEDYEKVHGKDSWNKVMIKLKKLDKAISRTKMFYDSISDKSFIRSSVVAKKSMGQIEYDVQKIFKRQFFKNSSKISVINKEIYDLFVFLVYNSPIQRMQIRNEYLKNLEQKDNRKIGLDRINREQRRMEE